MAAGPPPVGGGPASRGGSGDRGLGSRAVPTGRSKRVLSSSRDPRAAAHQGTGAFASHLRSGGQVHTGAAGGAPSATIRRRSSAAAGGRASRCTRPSRDVTSARSRASSAPTPVSGLIGLGTVLDRLEVHLRVAFDPRGLLAG